MASDPVDLGTFTDSSLIERRRESVLVGFDGSLMIFELDSMGYRQIIAINKNGGAVSLYLDERSSRIAAVALSASVSEESTSRLLQADSE